MTARYATIHDHTVRDAFKELLPPAHQHRRRAPRLRARRSDRRSRMGQAQPLTGPRHPAQRLLRPAAPAGLPAPQRLSHLPGLPDHPRVPRHPPQTGRLQPPPHRPSRRRRPLPPGRQPPQGPDQPRTHHPRPRSPRERAAHMSRADNSHHLLRAAVARHDVSIERTRAVIQELDRTGQAVTVSAVARAAAVSRSWIYSEPELRDTIARLRATSVGSAPICPSRCATSNL